MKLSAIIFLVILVDACIAQYKSPILTCVTRKSAGGASNDIFWKDPNETCGTFQNYSIYSSNNISGPYTLLTTINNQATTSYNHQGIDATKTHYYYMTSLYNCPGMSLNSDTLNDTLMAYPKLLSISIENNFPVYRWEPVISQNKIWAYVLINFGSSYVDTILGRHSSQYIDSSFNASSGIYTGHLVGSLSACGERGLAPPPYRHRPSYLSLVSNPCEDEIEMNWTRYQGWGLNDDVKNYDIYVQKNNGIEEKVATNDSSSRSFRYKDFKYGDTLCIRIKANHPTRSDVSAFSNQYCFISTKTQVPNLLQTLEASYLSNSKVKIRWYCSLDATPKSFDLLRLDIRNHSILSSIDKIKYISDGNGFYSFIDTSAPTDKSIYYRIRYEDLCNNKSSGIPGKSNFIELTQTGLYKNELTWQKKFFPDSIAYTVKRFEIYRIDDQGNSLKLIELSGDETKYEDNLELLYQSKGRFCYQMLVYYYFDTTRFIKDSLYQMNSQAACIDMRTVLWMPNAFKVNGFTPVFKPKLYFFDGSNFSMKIVNRWGKEIYHTADPEQGWNGTMENGINAPEDTYIYLISYIGNDGVKIDKTGTFVLMK